LVLTLFETGCVAGSIAIFNDGASISNEAAIGIAEPVNRRPVTIGVLNPIHESLGRDAREEVRIDWLEVA
jgi:hypothetical protein